MLIDTEKQSLKTHKALFKLSQRPKTMQRSSGVVIKQSTKNMCLFHVECRNLVTLMDLVRGLGGDLRG